MYLNKWKLDSAISSACRQVPRSVDNSSNPPGYIVNSSNFQLNEQANRSEQTHHLINKRAWDIALMPIKNVPMNLFMMYMSGNAISIFPIMMIFMMAWRPITALLSFNYPFKSLQDEHDGSLIPHKAVFIIGNMLVVSMALYKLYGMGLLPNSASDWLDFQKPQKRLQYSFVSDSFV